MTNERFLKCEDVIALTGLPRSSIYKRMNTKTFPQKINLGGRRVVWLESEVKEWMNQQIDNSRSKGNQ
ncbi:hypothetical protein JP34_07865 [Gallibacterium anatis]|uniref:helix-turn-helix transcriptional regulator n=1 Tax=Gallibacterium anatis TaxID=750 RepID=UPI000530CEC1|nr:AlpA family transcriptional regulator [Gallibacterium anatis]KGQ33760.1 hypothetical protein JP34_07865 [Gallibacterium anatis]